MQFWTSSPTVLESVYFGTDQVLESLVDEDDLTETDEKAALVFTPNVNGAYGCYYISTHINSKYPRKSSFYSGQVPTRPIYNNQGRRIGNEPVMSEEEFKEHKVKVQKVFKHKFYCYREYEKIRIEGKPLLKHLQNYYNNKKDFEDFLRNSWKFVKKHKKDIKTTC